MEQAAPIANVPPPRPSQGGTTSNAAPAASESKWFVCLAGCEPVGPVTTDLVARGLASGKVPRHAQVAAVLETLRIPGPERAHLVDHPALAAAGGPIGRVSRRAVAEPFALVDAFPQQHVDVVEEEPPAVGH